MQRLVTYYACMLAAAAPTRGGASAGPGLVPKRRWKSRITMISSLFGAVMAAAATESVTIKLGWDKNPEKNVASYELRYGTASGRYTEKISTTDNSVKVPDLREGKTYYFVVLAKNRSGLFSPPSEEITYKQAVRLSEPPESEIISPSDTLAIYTGDRVEFQGSASDPNGKSPFTYHWSFGAGSGIAPSTGKNPGFRQFNLPGTFTVSFTATNSQGRPDPTPAIRTIIVTERPNHVLSRTKWKIKHVSSEEKLDARAAFAFDGNPSTFWHSKWRGKVAKGPHDIQIDLKTTGNISGFRYLPRQDGITVGNIGKYEFYVSKDGKKWGKPVASGTFDGGSAEKQVMFTARTARYVKLRAIKAAGGESDCNVAELFVLTTPKRTSLAAETKAKGKKKAKDTTVARSATLSPTATPAADTVATETSTGIAVVDGRKYRVLTIRKDALPAGLKPVIQVSGDLLDWSSGAAHTTVLVDNARILRVRDNTPVTADGKRFIRLKPVKR